MVALRRTRPIAAYGMGPLLAGLFFHIHWIPLVFSPESGAGGCILGVLFFLPSATYSFPKAVRFFISFSIDVDIELLEWTRVVGDHAPFLGLHCDVLSSESKLFEQ